MKFLHLAAESRRLKKILNFHWVSPSRVIASNATVVRATCNLDSPPFPSVMVQDVGERVFLYIYDLSRGLARSLSPSLIGRQIDGVWHTSVVCFGYEYYYGQGIFVTDRVGQTQYGTPMEIQDMGVTELPQEVSWFSQVGLTCRCSLNTLTA